MPNLSTTQPHPTPHPTPLRIGILGCANIARQFARDVRPSAEVTVSAVASRTPASAKAFAADLGLAKAYGSYEALLADPAIDAVYLPLPNSLHAPWVVKAADAGKHVLCEKPMALNRQEAQAMFDAARRNRVMVLEAFPYYFQPQTGDMLALLGSGAIGQVRTVQACFGFSLQNPPGNIRLNPALGGGALLDAGSYPLSLIRLVMGQAPERVIAHPQWTPGGIGERVDIALMATLLYADGRSAQMSCAMNVANHRRATVCGTLGTLETEYLNHTSARGGEPSGYLPSLLRLRRGVANSIAYEEIKSPTGSGFRFCAEAFAQKIAAQDTAALDRAAAASLDLAATLDALAQSARLGQMVAVG